MKTVQTITGITGGFATVEDDTAAGTAAKGQDNAGAHDSSDTTSIAQLVASLQGIYVAPVAGRTVAAPKADEDDAGDTSIQSDEAVKGGHRAGSGSDRSIVNDALPTPGQTEQWHLAVLGNLNAIWADYTGAGINVGVYDEGIQKTHHDLDANYNAALELGGSVTVLNRAYRDPLDGGSTTNAGHGTSVAGLIAAENNGIGTIGVAYSSKVTAVNIFDDLSSAWVNNPSSYAGFYAALHEQERFDVVNHSWGSNPSFVNGQNLNNATGFAAMSAVEYSHVTVNGRNNLGTIIVKSAGNDDRNANGEGTHNLWETITVAAARDDGFASSYTNYGSNILVTAPAGDITSMASRGIVTTDLLGDQGYNVRMGTGESHDYTNAFGGTSAAAPIVSAVVALMLDANENLGWRDVQNILAASARHTGSSIGGTVNQSFETDLWQVNGANNWNGGGMHYSEDYGYGMVNAYNAVRMAEAWSMFGDFAKSSNNIQTATYNSGSIGITLNDTGTNGGLTEYSFNVASNVELEHVDLTLTITHPYFTDLRIELVSPDGETNMMLVDDSTRYYDVAATGLTWTYGIDALHGELSAGTWKIRFIDSISGDSGTLSNVSFAGRGGLIDNNDVYHYTDEFDLMVSKDLANRTILTDTAGTNDWINLAAKTGNVTINLTPGQMSSVGFLISNSTTIENVVTGDGNDKITGNTVANFLLGVRGNDTIDGGLGNDTMWGGAGNDTYTVNVLGDSVYESNSIKAVGGDDHVQFLGAAGNTYILGDHVERLTLLTNTVDTNGTGNGLANTLTGNARANTLDGKAGSDTMIGGDGTDTYFADVSTDVVTETNTVTATGGNDLVYYNGAGGTTFTLGNNVERLTLMAAQALHGTGNALANTITGNTGANTLKGLGGNDSIDGGINNDRMEGGDGSDTYYADSQSDVVAETNTVMATGGDDIVFYGGGAGTTFTLGTSVERLTLTGSSGSHGTGNTLANKITGNTGANTLKGLGGNDSLDGGTNTDRLEGGDGSDTFYADVITDAIIETNTVMATGGDDTVIFNGAANAKFTLGANVERLTLAGSNATSGQGNALANTLVGNSGANKLNGMEGKDTLTGGTGIDHFQFSTTLNATTNVDTITSFESNGIDEISLTKAIFGALGKNAGGVGEMQAGFFHAAAGAVAGAAADDRIIYNSTDGTLRFDADGNKAGGVAAILFAQFTTKPIGAGVAGLDATDFLIV